MKKKSIFVAVVVLLLTLPTLTASAADHHIYVLKGSSTSGFSPYWVYSASGTAMGEKYDCNDFWIGFHGVAQNKIIPTNKLRIWATNWWNQQHIKAQNPDGLNGYFECYQDVWCNVFLCGKNGGSYDGWSHRLETLP